ELSGLLFFFSSRRRHTRLVSDWSSDVCSSDLYSATDGGNMLDGRGGNDVLVGGPGADILLGGSGQIGTGGIISGGGADQVVYSRSEERRGGKEGWTGEVAGGWRKKAKRRKTRV